MTPAEIYQEWAALAGMRCTCPPDCSTTERWGAGPADCDPACEPCSIMAGREYHRPPKTKNGGGS